MEYAGAWRERDYVKKILWIGISGGSSFLTLTDVPCNYTECLRLMHTLFETLFLSNEMRQKYNVCYVWSRRLWKSIATRSSFFMCINKHGGEIIIRRVQVVTEVLLESGECCWSSTTLKGWIWYTTTNKGNSNKNPRHVRSTLRLTQLGILNRDDWDGQDMKNA